MAICRVRQNGIVRTIVQLSLPSPPAASAASMKTRDTSTPSSIRRSRHCTTTVSNLPEGSRKVSLGIPPEPDQERQNRRNRCCGC